MSDADVSVLADAIALLREEARLKIVEFGAAGIVVWEVRRDESGTPRCRFRRPVPWTMPDEQLNNLVRDNGDLLICSSPSSPTAVGAFAQFRDRAGAYTSTEPLDELLQQAIARDPIVYPYGLVVLRQTKAGELRLGTLELFGAGARYGDHRSFTVRCEPTDEKGTVFPVVADREPFSPVLVSLESVNVAPGVYLLTAELARHGVVRFGGLPSVLQPDPRVWREHRRVSAGAAGATAAPQIRAPHLRSRGERRAGVGV